MNYWSFKVPTKEYIYKDYFKLFNNWILIVEKSSNSMLSWSIQAAITEIPYTGWHKQQAFVSHSSRVWKSEIRVPAWSSSCEGLFLGGRWLTSNCFLTWWRAERGSKFSGDSYNSTNPMYEGSTLMTSCNPNYPQRPPLLIPSHWEVGFWHMNFGRTHTFSS